MTKLWFLLLLQLLLHTKSAGKLTTWENEMLKKKCIVKPSGYDRNFDKDFRPLEAVFCLGNKQSEPKSHTMTMEFTDFEYQHPVDMEKFISAFERRQPASSYEYPFAAALCVRGFVPGKGLEEEDHSLPECSGVLISPRHILTSAVCLYMDYQYSCTHGIRSPKLSERNIGILLSSKCTNSECWFNEKMLKPTSVVMHPSYKDCMRDGSYDLAVIELEKDMNVEPICMPYSAYSAISRPEELKYIGYGVVDGERSLQSLWYQYISEEGRTIFAFNMTMDTDHGAEDNGGPLIQKMKGRHYFFGIHAGYGYRVHNSGGRQIPIAKGTVFADVRKHLTWICDVTESSEQFGWVPIVTKDTSMHEKMRLVKRMLGLHFAQTEARYAHTMVMPLNSLERVPAEITTDIV